MKRFFIFIFYLEMAVLKVRTCFLASSLRPQKALSGAITVKFQAGMRQKLLFAMHPGLIFVHPPCPPFFTSQACFGTLPPLRILSGSSATWAGCLMTPWVTSLHPLAILLHWCFQLRGWTKEMTRYDLNVRRFCFSLKVLLKAVEVQKQYVTVPFISHKAGGLSLVLNFYSITHEPHTWDTFDLFELDD